jgi:hypothetical protein
MEDAIDSGFPAPEDRAAVRHEAAGESYTRKELREDRAQGAA